MEKSLFKRLDEFPRISTKDYGKLRDLGDLLMELQGAREEGYLTGLTYLDTARGIGPIVEKLPQGLQEKWLSVGSRFKEDNNGYFPPFDYFADFICQEARRRNDPSFILLCASSNGLKLDLGWVLIGDVCLGNAHKPAVSTFKTSVLENGRPSILKPCEGFVKLTEDMSHGREQKNKPHKASLEALGLQVFNETESDNKPAPSIEDTIFLEIMDQDMYIDTSNNWVAPLPFRVPRQRLSNNREQVFTRFTSPEKTLRRKTEMRDQFLEFMKKMFDNRHAEVAPLLEENEECWYLPTFGVYHPQKPGSIRVVFDSSAKYFGTSLNGVLLSGPDLNNSLIGVLIRFRKEQVAVIADIQQMFHCFLVRRDHRNYLRFLWYRDNDMSKDVIDYRMRVHVFGNSPSPSVAIYGLRKAIHEVLAVEVAELIQDELDLKLDAIKFFCDSKVVLGYIHNQTKRFYVYVHNRNQTWKYDPRLKHADLSTQEKNPIILPKNSHVSLLLVRQYHEEVKHQGRHFTEGALRAAGFWVLHQLYYDPDMERKKMAQKWLTQAQALPQAWQFCWALLAPDKLAEIQFFGASTLHAKISRHWGDLPDEQHQTLRVQLLAHISHFSSGPKMVLTRLCVALSSLALHTMPHAWPQAVADMVAVFRPEKAAATAASSEEATSHSHCLALLELLTVLPEEFQSSRLPQARRAQLREALAGQWAVVCPLLRQLLQGQESPSQVKEKVLRCLSSWVGLDVPLGESQELVQDCFAALADPELFETAVETLVTAISQPDCQRYTDALVNLMPLVLGLHDQLKAAAQQGDMETSHGICRIAVALGETHSRTLLDQVDHWQGFLALVNMILFCTGIPGHYPVNETTSSLTLTFWYTLQDDILSYEEEKQAVYLQVYRPVYFQLVDVLLHKAHYPAQEEYAAWAADDKEEFRVYRVDISDTLMYVYEMLGAELLSNLYDRLGRLLMDTEQPAEWSDTEALLFGFQSIAETIDVNYSDVIPGLIALIPRINISNVMLADTVMYTIGSLAEWLADHPVMLGTVLPMVLQGLVKAELSVSTVSTLKRICRECCHDLAPYAHDIMAVSQDVLVKEIHKSSQCMWLMQALGFLLCSLPEEQILGSLHSLISPHAQRLDTLGQLEPNPSDKVSILRILGMLSSLFTTLDIHRQDEYSDRGAQARAPPARVTPNPVVVALQQVLPLIQTVASKWLRDSEVVEAVCGVFEKSARTLLLDFAPVVPQLSAMLGQLYRTFPQASALDLTRQMVCIFAGEKDHFPPINSLIELVTSTTLTIFQQGPRDHPDIAESFMQLHAQALKRKPDSYLSDHIDVKALFYCGILSLKFPETPTVKAASFFFTVLVPHCGDSPTIGQVLHRDGKLLVHTILEAVGGGSPCCLMEHFSEVLFCLNRHCPPLLTQWLKEGLQSPHFPSAQVSTEQKDTFSQQLLREQTSKRRVKEIVKEFSLLCRGLQ
ncbi:importin-13-like [Aplochiton taeniatus]